MKRLFHKFLKFYIYLRFGIVNYLNMFIALFNTANLVWGFTPLHKKIGLFKFILIFLGMYIPIATVLGYYDLKKGVSKVTQEVSPFWRRATFLERKQIIGTFFPFPPTKTFKDMASERLYECWKEAYLEGLRWIVSKGKIVPKSECFCKAFYKEGLINEESYRKCLEVARSEK